MKDLRVVKIVKEIEFEAKHVSRDNHSWDI